MLSESNHILEYFYIIDVSWLQESSLVDNSPATVSLSTKASLTEIKSIRNRSMVIYREHKHPLMLDHIVLYPL